MLNRFSNRKEKGFTIIEVLIVLAIAGLILLVIFLAVPALQRNARNTQRKEDISRILGGISEYVNNNNGVLPTAVSVSSGTLTIGASGSNQVPVTLGYYGTVTLGAYTGTSTNSTTIDTVSLLTGGDCSTTTIGQPISGSTRGIVALYTVEPAAKQCSSS